MGSTLTSALLLLLIGDLAPRHTPANGETQERYVWEVDLAPGTFRLHCDKLPSLPPGRYDVHYFTVAFHTPDNVQFAVASGVQPPRSAGFKELLLAPAVAAVRVEEVRKTHGGKEQQYRVIANNAEGFVFTLHQKTRAFFAAEIVSQEPERAEAKGLGLLKDWSAWRHSYEPQHRRLPLLVHWDAEREVYELGVECRGEHDFRDWLITVDYLE